MPCLCLLVLINQTAYNSNLTFSNFKPLTLYYRR
nr:MAG TPA: hypothetical protein [Caudoviricetes sp.]